jgi:hypothetical protein
MRAVRSDITTFLPDWPIIAACRATFDRMIEEFVTVWTIRDV